MKYVFGVFRGGQLIVPMGLPVECSPAAAGLIVGILDLAKGCLEPGDYMACDYLVNQNADK